MALFGRNWKSRLGTIGATLQDVGSNLGGGPSGYLNNYQAQQRALAQKAAQDAAYGKLQGILSPQAPQAQGAPTDTQGLTPFAAALQGQAQGAPPAPPQPQQQGISWDQLLPVLVDLQHNGGDTTDILKAYQMAHPTKEYQGVNMGDGNFGSFDPSTGQIQDLRTDPYAARRGDLLDAQIQAAKALGGQREASAGLSQAKARVGGFAPPRKSSGGAKSVGHQLPAGAVLIP